MNKKLKKLPEFKNEDEERQFWATHDSTEYLDWSNAEVLREPLVPREAASGLLQLHIPIPAEKRLSSLAAKNTFQKKPSPANTFLKASNANVPTRERNPCHFLHPSLNPENHVNQWSIVDPIAEGPPWRVQTCLTQSVCAEWARHFRTHKFASS